MYLGWVDVLVCKYCNALSTGEVSSDVIWELNESYNHCVDHGRGNASLSAVDASDLPSLIQTNGAPPLCFLQSVWPATFCLSTDRVKADFLLPCSFSLDVSVQATDVLVGFVPQHCSFVEDGGCFTYQSVLRQHTEPQIAPNGRTRALNSSSLFTVCVCVNRWIRSKL